MNPRKASFVLVSSLALAACGGGGGGSTPPPPTGGNPPPSGGIGRTGLAVGPISNFGSVVVNGVRYDTSAATFTVDDAPGVESDLSVGQVVIVKGEIDADGVNGTADEVIYDDALEGPISAIDIAAGTVVVLGQTVIIDAGTSFDDDDFTVASIEGLQVNDIIEVSGFVDGDGNILATRIERDDDNDDFERKGIVASLDTSALTFTIGTLEVDYSAATLEDFPGGDITEGDLVEVEGTIDPNNANRLLAVKVEFEDPFEAFDTDDDVEIEGIVTRFLSETDFDVNGIPVTTDGDTEFENGSAADLALNVRIEVEGEFTSNGVILADDIEFRAENDTRVAAQVDAVDTAAGTLTVLGITITTNALTRFEDQSSSDDGTPLNLDDLNIGDYVEVRGSETPADSDMMVASRLERDDDRGEAELRGIVDAVSEPTLTVLGVTIETNAQTEFEDADEQPLSAAEFFAAVQLGATIEVTGTESSATVLVAEEVELEDDND